MKSVQKPIQERRSVALRIGVLCLTSVLCSAGILGCGDFTPPPQTYAFDGPIMGTTYSIRVVVDEIDADQEETLRTSIYDALQAVNAAMSTYDSESELSRWNNAAAGPIAVSEETFRVFDIARQVGLDSGGALDVTVGPLVQAWGFGAGADPADLKGPSPEEVAALRQRIGWSRLEFDESTMTVTKLADEVRCDLSSVAKGFAVDQVARILEAEGLDRFMVEVGGEVRTAGARADGNGWRIGIETPGDFPGGVERILSLGDRAMATSGDYRNYREVEGRRVSHLLDPRTGEPIGHRLASASVVTTECAVADAWATAMMVLGPEQGMETAQELGLAVLFLVRTEEGKFEQWWSPAFDALLAETKDSSASASL